LLDAGYPKWHGDDRNFPKRYDFEIIEAFENGTSTCYRIRFLPKPDNPANAKFFCGGEMVVNIDDFAVIDWKYVVNFPMPGSHPAKASILNCRRALPIYNTWCTQSLRAGITPH
jgi:hypothetical protein